MLYFNFLNGYTSEATVANISVMRVNMVNFMEMLQPTLTPSPLIANVVVLNQF